MKNCKYDELNWAELCLKKTDTYHRLMEVASEMTQYKHESSMEITDRTRTVVGVCLNVMYEQMYDDPRRTAFAEQIDSFIKYVYRVSHIDEVDCRELQMNTCFQHKNGGKMS